MNLSRGLTLGLFGNRPRPFELGFSVPYARVDGRTSGELDVMFARATALGASWVRIDTQVQWIMFGATKPTTPYWGVPDLIFGRACAAGLKVQSQIMGVPDWAGGGRYPSAAQRSAYATACGEIATRYNGTTIPGTKVSVWEMTNEPNLGATTTETDPAELMALMNALVPALRAAVPGTPIVGPGLSPAQDSAASPTQGAAEYATALYAGGLQALNLEYPIGVHPYVGSAMPSGTEAWNGWQVMRDVRAVMVAAGDSAKQIMVTEFGCPTAGTVGTTAVTEAEAAARITDAGTQHKTSSWLGGPLYIYELVDKDVPGATTSTEGYFGAYTNAGAEKTPITAAIRALTGR